MLRVLLSLWMLAFARKEGHGRHLRNLRLSSAALHATAPNTAFGQVAVSGLFSADRSSMDGFVARVLFEENVASQIKVVSPNSALARKRLVSPTTVYSGMVSRIGFSEVCDDTSLASALEGVEGWLAFNATPAQVPQLLQIASSTPSLRRAVLAVQESSEDLSRPHNYHLPAGERLACTILRHEDCSVAPGDLGPYRITRGETAVAASACTAFGAPSRLGLALGNLYRVAVQSLVLPTTGQKVFRVARGSALDSEILAMMKAQGWTPAQQATVLLGDVMEDIERRYAKELESFKLRQRTSAR